MEGGRDGAETEGETQESLLHFADSQMREGKKMCVLV